MEYIVNLQRNVRGVLEKINYENGKKIHANHSDRQLHLSVGPSMKSWNVLIGILSIGVGSVYYSPDQPLLLKIFFLIGCLFLGLTLFDDWEDCVIDKKEKFITLSQKTWFDIIFSRFSEEKTLNFDREGIISVKLTAEDTIMGTMSKSYRIELVLRSSGAVPVFETATGPKREQERIAQLIGEALGLGTWDPTHSYYPNLGEDSSDESCQASVQHLEFDSNF